MKAAKPSSTTMQQPSRAIADPHGCHPEAKRDADERHRDQSHREVDGPGEAGSPGVGAKWSKRDREVSHGAVALVLDLHLRSPNFMPAASASGWRLTAPQFQSPSWNGSRTYSLACRSASMRSNASRVK